MGHAAESSDITGRDRADGVGRDLDGAVAAETAPEVAHVVSVELPDRDQQRQCEEHSHEHPHDEHCAESCGARVGESECECRCPASRSGYEGLYERVVIDGRERDGREGCHDTNGYDDAGSEMAEGIAD